MTVKKPLPEGILQRLSDHAARGRKAAAEGDSALAETEFLAAWACLPEPRTEFDYAQSLSSGLVEFFRDRGMLDKARAWYAVTREAYGDAANPTIAFLGATVDFESGDLDGAFKAFDALYRRYKSRPFDGESKKYLEFYKKRLAGA